MASGNATPNYHSQLAAGTVDTVTMDREWTFIEVINVDGASRIDFTVDGTTPAEGGTPEGRVLPASINSDVVDVQGKGAVMVKLISAGTPHYSIIGGD